MGVRSLFYSCPADSADDDLGGLSAKINDENGLMGHGMPRNLPGRRFPVDFGPQPARVPVEETTALQAS